VLKYNNYAVVQIQFYAFLTSAIEDISGQLHSPAVLTLSKGPQYLSYRRLGGPQIWSGHGKSLFPQGIKHQSSGSQ
jgi:hypothetical protein